MAFKDEKKKAQKLRSEGKSQKDIVPILEKESSRFNTLSDQAKQRNVYNWILSEEMNHVNWIDEYKGKHHGNFPPIPEWMTVVKAPLGITKMSKNLDMSIPSMEWWNGLLPSNQEQVLQTVDWLCKYKKDWWCKNREDYLARMKQQIAGITNPIRMLPKRKLA